MVFTRCLQGLRTPTEASTLNAKIVAQSSAPSSSSRWQLGSLAGLWASDGMSISIVLERHLGSGASISSGACLRHWNCFRALPPHSSHSMTCSSHASIHTIPPILELLVLGIITCSYPSSSPHSLLATSGARLGCVRADGGQEEDGRPSGRGEVQCTTSGFIEIVIRKDWKCPIQHEACDYRDILFRAGCHDPEQRVACIWIVGPADDAANRTSEQYPQQHSLYLPGLTRHQCVPRVR